MNVKQIGNYPVAGTAGTDLLLMQAGVGGAYYSITTESVVSGGLASGGWVELAPDNGIVWGDSHVIPLVSPALVFQSGGAGQFRFSHLVNAPAFLADGNIKAATLTTTGAASLASLTVNGQTAATVDYVTANTVASFNDRTGVVQLTVEDVMRAGALPQINPHMAGVCTAPTLWNFNDCSDGIATTAWVQGAIFNAASSGVVVRSFNGRGGCVVLNAADITAALTVPGVYGLANTPPSGDASKKISTTMFVDNAIVDVQAWTTQQINDISSQLDQKYAPLDSPQLVGIPTAPTAAQTVNSGQLATTAFVHAAVTASTTGVASWNGRTGTVTLTLADVTGAGGAPIASPAFTGVPTTATTPAPGDNTTKLATTAFVQAAIGAITSGVTSWNTRTGAVTLTAADITAAGGALLASPALSGTPTAPTPLPADNSTTLATTAYVTHALSVLPAPVTSFNGRTGAVSFQASDISAVGGALLAGPAFTGVPTAPTATVGTSNTQIANTAFVATAVAAVTSAVTSFNGRTGAVTLTATDITGAGGAVLASPTFTGIPAAPTATAGTNSTQLATTAFVTAALAAAPGGVSSFNARTGAITLLGSDVSAAGGAMISSPSFSGTPTAPTPAPGANNTQLATTAFVTAALTASGGVSSFNGRAGAVTLLGADITGAGGALLAGPVFTGDPQAPTPAAGDNDTSIATTAFVQSTLRLRNYLSGFILSNDATTPNTVLDIAAGQAMDSTNAATINGTAFKKTTATWVAGSGNGGLGTGLTLAASTKYAVFAAIIAGAYDVFLDTVNPPTHQPAGTTAYRRVGWILTDASSNIRVFSQAFDRISMGAISIFGPTSTSQTNLLCGAVIFPPNCETIVYCVLSAAAATTASVSASPVNNTTASVNLFGCSNNNAAALTFYGPSTLGPLTDASGNIWVSCSLQSTTSSAQAYGTGWIDNRGKDGGG